MKRKLCLLKNHIWFSILPVYSFIAKAISSKSPQKWPKKRNFKGLNMIPKINAHF